MASDGVVEKAFVAPHGSENACCRPATRLMGVPVQCYPLVEWPGRCSPHQLQLENILEEREKNPFHPPQCRQQTSKASRPPPARKASWAPGFCVEQGASECLQCIQCLLVRQPYTRADPQPALRQSRFDDAPQPCGHVDAFAQPFSDATIDATRSLLRCMEATLRWVKKHSTAVSEH